MKEQINNLIKKAFNRVMGKYQSEAQSAHDAFLMDLNRVADALVLEITNGMPEAQVLPEDKKEEVVS